MIHTLPKQFAMKGRGTPFFYNDNWITNGKFAINKSIVKDSYKYCLVIPGVNHPDIDRVIPEINGYEITKTNRIIDDKGLYVRVFVDSWNKEFYVSDEIIQHFDISVLVAMGDTDPFITPDGLIVVMPCRKPEGLS